MSWKKGRDQVKEYLNRWQQQNRSYKADQIKLQKKDNEILNLQAVLTKLKEDNDAQCKK